MEDHNLLDIDGKKIQLGHIVVVRYIWNSYAGEVTVKGLYVGGRYHQMKDTAHYQIIGHSDKDHKDYREDVSLWLNSYYQNENQECPVKIRVYEDATV